MERGETVVLERAARRLVTNEHGISVTWGKENITSMKFLRIRRTLPLRVEPIISKGRGANGGVPIKGGDIDGGGKKTRDKWCEVFWVEKGRHTSVARYASCKKNKVCPEDERERVAGNHQSKRGSQTTPSEGRALQWVGEVEYKVSKKHLTFGTESGARAGERV